MSDESFPDFSGKTISMMLIDESHSHDLDNPSFEYQGGRLFITGIIPVMATESGWNGNQIGAVAWDRVRDYTLFPDLKTYENAVAKSEVTQENAEKDT